MCRSFNPPLSGYRAGAVHAIIAVAFWLGSAFASGAVAMAQGTVQQKRLCSGVVLEGGEGESIPSLNDTEVRLLCGDPKSSSWKVIPRSQARFLLRNFLQERGLFHPSFETRGEALIVRVGTPTRVSRLTAQGAPDSLRLERKRKVVGEILTPGLLSNVEKWATQRLGAEGYPCPEVRAEGDPDTGEILVHVNPGPRQRLISVVEPGIEGLASGLLRRYDAFQLGELYNGDWLTVTSNRIVADGIADNSYFTATCSPDGAVARQEVVTGPARLVSLGFGTDTEGVLLLRASWRNARMGLFASTAQVEALASAREQRLTGSFNWFHLPYVSRRSLRPSLELRHQNEQFFETVSATGRVPVSTTWDNQQLGLSLRVGPALEYVRTLRGQSGQQDSRFLSLETTAGLRTHDFEYYKTSPRVGGALDALVALNSETIFSSVTAHRLELHGEALWNYRDYDPPLWILGWRGGAYLTLSPDRPGPQTRLPANYLRYLGGAADLRGFGRQELPTDGQGGMTAVYTSLEWRMAGYLPAGFQPFVFVDLGMIGKDPWALGPPLYTSPGVGLRWESPFGVFRTTFAHGYPLSVPGHFQFYFSFGEEF